jgi:uncharacterized protein CbrC (UPF0167 family)
MPDLPTFRYHPDPIATDSVQTSNDPCDVCGLDRGLMYSGPVYSASADEPTICPWCIGDGSAATVLHADFTDVGWGVPNNVPPEVLDEVAHRTPGFSGWQQEHWLYHCDDAAVFLGRVGHRELEALPGAMEMLLHENDAVGWTSSQAEAYVRQLDPDGEATGYWFRCLVCGADLAYSDEA